MEINVIFRFNLFFVRDSNKTSNISIFILNFVTFY